MVLGQLWMGQGGRNSVRVRQGGNAGLEGRAGQGRLAHALCNKGLPPCVLCTAGPGPRSGGGQRDAAGEAEQVGPFGRPFAGPQQATSLSNQRAGRFPCPAGCSVGAAACMQVQLAVECHALSCLLPCCSHATRHLPPPPPIPYPLSPAPDRHLSLPPPCCSHVTNTFHFLFSFDLKRDDASGAYLPPKQVVPATGGWPG